MISTSTTGRNHIMALMLIPATGGNVKITPTRERTSVQMTVHDANGKAVVVTLNRSEANALSKSLARAVQR